MQLVSSLTTSTVMLLRASCNHRCFSGSMDSKAPDEGASSDAAKRWIRGSEKYLLLWRSE